MHVLIVDDEPEIATMLGRMLSGKGHEFSTAATGSAALTSSLLNEYDLLICDLMLPDLQGDEIVRALKAQSPRLPVIVISALDPADWEQRVIDAGATTYLQKPLKVADLMREVDLVAKARLDLHVGIIDGDPIEQTRLLKTLAALGCEVIPLRSTEDAHASIESGRIGLLLIDAGFAGAKEIVAKANAKQILVVAAATPGSGANDDELMRAGAALMMSRPIDIDAFLTQASFLKG